MSGDLWECPSCGRRFANTNQTHSCGNPTLDEVLQAQSDRAVAIFNSVESALAMAGQYRIHPQKTRIAFITRMSFAGVQFARNWVNMSFILARPVDDARIRQIDLYGPTSFGHHIRLHEAGDVDQTVTNWLAEAKRRGDQTTLDPRASVKPVSGRALGVLRIPLRAEVTTRGMRVPRYAGEALAASAKASARIRGHDYEGRIVAGADGHFVVIQEANPDDPQLKEGERVDLVLSAPAD